MPTVVHALELLERCVSFLFYLALFVSDFFVSVFSYECLCDCLCLTCPSNIPAEERSKQLGNVAVQINFEVRFVY